MYLKNIVESKYTIISSAALILVPYYAWRRLYNSYKNMKDKYKEGVLFQERHNCVIMYSQTKGMSGWPPYTGRIQVDFSKESCLDALCEPIIYFIDTAKKSLDLAFMVITVKTVYKALIRAHQKGVKIRLLLNFEHTDSKLDEIRNLIKQGIEVLTYVSQGLTRMSSIMHYKYMVKDYTETGGFVFSGSMNLTNTGFINNYEDAVFTSNQYVVKAFYENFEECWNFVKIDNEDLINKTTLLDANLI